MPLFYISHISLHFQTKDTEMRVGRKPSVFALWPAVDHIGFERTLIFKTPRLQKLKAHRRAIFGDNRYMHDWCYCRLSEEF